jgi:polycomb protein EED
MRRNNDGKKEIYYEDGTVTIFRWIGFDRFFPPGQDKFAKVLRGCSSVLRLLFLRFHEANC